MYISYFFLVLVTAAQRGWILLLVYDPGSHMKRKGRSVVRITCRYDRSHAGDGNNDMIQRYTWYSKTSAFPKIPKYIITHTLSGALPVSLSYPPQCTFSLSPRSVLFYDLSGSVPRLVIHDYMRLFLSHSHCKVVPLFVDNNTQSHCIFVATYTHSKCGRVLVVN